MNWNNAREEKPRLADGPTLVGPESRGSGVGFERDAGIREGVGRTDITMVTFSLAGTDYGVDVMKVKEAVRFEKLTCVPNTQPFVAGVYNLRGQIVSVIDLRALLNLPQAGRQETPIDGLILHLDDSLIGVIVDRVDRVIGIPAEAIQPQHPISVNGSTAHISGLAGYEDRVYVMLDLEHVFRRDGEGGGREGRTGRGVPAGQPLAAADVAAATGAVGKEGTDVTDEDLRSVADGLALFNKLHVTPVNRQWVCQRLEEWRRLRGEAQTAVQLADERDAADFAATFGSACSGRLWDRTYGEAVRNVMPTVEGAVVNAWNPGCGRGLEAYSLAVLMSEQYPDKRVKVWAGDNDLLAISSAPSVSLAADAVPAYVQSHTVETGSELTFSGTLKAMILFEYHDILHQSDVPQSHICVCRDLLSILKPDDQQKVLSKLHETIVTGGVLIVGENERLDHDVRWEMVSDRIAAYRKI